jgi:hypothetical protein
MDAVVMGWGDVARPDVMIPVAFSILTLFLPHLRTPTPSTTIDRYILIEGKTEMAVRQAKRELQRVLDEETLRVGARPQFGRYSVV